MTKPEPLQAHYRKLLAMHDWFYAFSDDGTVYRKGCAERKELYRLRPVCDPDNAIWNEYAPKEFRK